MSNLKAPTEKLPYLLLATFLLISTANYAFSSKDNFITQNMKVASAKTSVETNGANTLPVSAKLITPNNETNFSLPISRNPFRLPSEILLNSVKINNKNTNVSNQPNNLPLANNYPILNGTIISKEKSSIIAIYNGKSNYYELGDKIGPYELKSIEKDTIVVSNKGKDKTIKLGETKFIPPTVKKQLPNSLNQKNELPSIKKGSSIPQNNSSLTNLNNATKTNLTTIGRTSNVNSSIVQPY